MEFIKCILAIIFLMFLFIRAGILIKKIIKSKSEDISTTILYGFFTIIAVFEIIAIPFNIFNLKTNILFWIELIIWGLIILLSFIVKRADNKYKLNLKDKIENLKNKKLAEKVIIAIFVLLVVFQIGNSMYLQRSDADDSFYVSWSEQAKQFEQYMETEPSTGQENSIFPKTYVMNSWEIFNGFIAKIFDVSVPVLLHTFYPMLIITIAYISYFLLIKRITNNKNPYIMAIIFAILILFDGASARFRGSTLLGRCHQGKAIVLNVIITFIYYKLLNYKELKKEDIIILAIANLASIALNPIAIWLIPIIYFLFAVYMLIKKDIKSIFKLVAILIPNFLTLPIFVICSLMASSGAVEVTNILSYNHIIKDFIRSGYLYIALYAISSIVVLIKGNKKAKVLIVFIPMIAFITILNPLISKYIQKYVTSSATYWRLLWIIPMEIGIAYAIYLICENMKNEKIKYIVLTLGIIIAITCGSYMYQEKNLFYKHENVQKIDKNIVQQTKFIEKNIKDRAIVVAPPEPRHGSNMRQVSTKIVLFYSRMQYVNMMNNYKEKERVYWDMYGNKNVEALYELMEKWNAQFIILDKGDELIQKVDNNKAQIVYEDENNIIFCRK